MSWLAKKENDAIKKMCIKIDIDTNRDSPSRVKELVLSIIDAGKDVSMAIDSVSIDEEDNYKIGVGWMNDLNRHLI